MLDRTEIVKALQHLQNVVPLDPAQPDFANLYVADIHTRAENAIEKLLTKIEISAGTQHVYLFSGTIGSGKSTELLRLSYKLRESGENYSIVVDAVEYLNPLEKPTIIDLLMAIALGVWDHCRKHVSADDFATNSRWEWFRSLLQAQVEIKEAEISAGPIKFKAALRDNPTFRERLRKQFEGSFEQLQRDVHAFLGELADLVRHQKQLPPEGKLVIIIDSLEHFGGMPNVGQSDEVLQGIMDIFSHNGRALRIPGWSVIYSVPPLLSKLAPGMVATLGAGGYYALTSAHVFADRSEEEDADTIDSKLMPLVAKRLGEALQPQLIESALLREVVRATGGDLRDLLRVTREILLSALSGGQLFPVTRESPIFERVCDEFRRPYLPFTRDVALRLQKIRKHNEAELLEKKDWFEVIGDLAQKRILLYLNGTEWYDVHPLLREPLRRQLERYAEESVASPAKPA